MAGASCAEILMVIRADDVNMNGPPSANAAKFHYPSQFRIFNDVQRNWSSPVALILFRTASRTVNKPTDTIEVILAQHYPPLKQAARSATHNYKCSKRTRSPQLPKLRGSRLAQKDAHTCPGKCSDEPAQPDLVRALQLLLAQLQLVLHEGRAVHCAGKFAVEGEAVGMLLLGSGVGGAPMTAWWNMLCLRRPQCTARPTRTLQPPRRPHMTTTCTIALRSKPASCHQLAALQAVRLAGRPCE